MRQWRLIHSGPASGARNMALDEALLLEVAAQPVLRFYSWRPCCLSLGYGQRCRLVDMQRLRERDYTLVRRPSGGGGILHADELTWSLVLPAGHQLAAGSLGAGYRRIGELLYAALRSLGVEVRMSQRVSPDSSGPACFETPAQHELTVGGRKLLGSARVQRRYGLLQHGSLPLSGDVAAICDLLRYPQDLEREMAAMRLRQRAVTLSEACDGREVGGTQVAAAIEEAFRSVYDVSFCESQFTKQELVRAAELERSRYGNPAWVCRR